jgi:hypothetical protein
MCGSCADCRGRCACRPGDSWEWSTRNTACSPAGLCSQTSQPTGRQLTFWAALADSTMLVTSRSSCPSTDAYHKIRVTKELPTTSLLCKEPTPQPIRTATTALWPPRSTAGCCGPVTCWKGGRQHSCTVVRSCRASCAAPPPSTAQLTAAPEWASQKLPRQTSRRRSHVASARASLRPRDASRPPLLQQASCTIPRGEERLWAPRLAADAAPSAPGGSHDTAATTAHQGPAPATRLGVPQHDTACTRCRQPHSVAPGGVEAPPGAEGGRLPRRTHAAVLLPPASCAWGTAHASPAAAATQAPQPATA